MDKLNKINKHAIILSDVAYERGFVLLGEYINSSTKVEMWCPEGHIFAVTPNHFKNGSGCPTCKKINAKISEKEMVDQINKLCKNMEYKFIGFVDGWRGMHKSKIILHCNKHNITNKPKTLYHFMKGHGCMCCSKYKD